MKKTFKILNSILIASALILGYCYYEIGGLTMKGIASFGFVMLGTVNLIYALKCGTDNKRFPVLMFCGLVFCMIGDIALNINFITGALIFAVGHIFYFAAYCALKGFKLSDAVPSAIIFFGTTVFLTVTPIFNFDPIIMQYVCIAYAFIISCMVGKAMINCMRERTPANTVIAVGSILFFISDLMLVLYMFGGAPHICDTLCLFTYYPAQTLLAHSVYKAQK